jgi:RNA polymerase sigma-70 factor (ECF subfamily)
MDRELVVRARAGDAGAFAELAERVLGRMNAIARLVLLDHDRAEDAVQDAIVEAWRSIRGLRDPDRFDGWLYRLIVRACQDRERRDRKRRLREVLPPDGMPVDVRDPAPSMDDVLALSDQLDVALRRLAADQRAVLVLIYYLDLSTADAATALGVPVGTVKSRLHRAMAGLRASLDAEERRGMLTTERFA